MGLLDERSDRFGHLSALALPISHAFEVDAALVLGLAGIVPTEDFKELAVTRAACVASNHAVGGHAVAASLTQSDLDHFESPRPLPFSYQRIGRFKFNSIQLIE